MVLGTSLLSTQHYKVRIKGKVEQSREKSSALPYTTVVVVIEKGVFRSPSTTVANFPYLLLAFNCSIPPLDLDKQRGTRIYKNIILHF